MFLSKLRIRGKLAALILLPLLVIVGLSAGIAISQVNHARAAGNTVRSVDVASAIGLIVVDLQSERLESVGYLINQASLGDVSSTASDVDELVSDLQTQSGAGLSPAIRNALAIVGGLAPLRSEVAAKTTTPTAVLAAYRAVITDLIDSTRLVNNVDTSTSAGREVVALDALLHIDELTNESAAVLVELAGDNEGATPDPNQQALVEYQADQASIAQLLPRFTTYATPAEVSLHNLVSQSFVNRVGPDFANSFALNPIDTAEILSPPVLYPQMQSFVVLGRFAEQKTAADVVASVLSQRNRALVEAYLTGALGIIVVAGVAILGLFIARSVAVPLARLTTSTNRIARLAEGELLRVADDESETTEPIPFEPVHITTDDEIGELARAFERISRTSVQLVGRQVASRRNVAQMFGHVGRRTQNLVGRQISLIDSLEEQETDARRLGELYRLDHLTSRLRRNASSLVALSGTSDQAAYFAPIALVDVIRLGLGEIEEYTRVDVNAPADLMIAPGAINDLTLLLAELMENATTFSPPHTRVAITAHANLGRVTITDQGIGLTPERMAEENARLAQRERLDLAPTEVLGLFVVGRLARRYGLTVVLTGTPGGGVTVTVDIANVLIAVGPPALTSTITAPAPAISAVESYIDADGLFDVQSLDRATHAIESGRPWNAFELPQPALPAGPTWATTPALPDVVQPQFTPSSPQQFSQPAPDHVFWPAAEPTVTVEWAAGDTGLLPAVPQETSQSQPYQSQPYQSSQPHQSQPYQSQPYQSSEPHQTQPHLPQPSAAPQPYVPQSPPPQPAGPSTVPLPRRSEWAARHRTMSEPVTPASGFTPGGGFPDGLGDDDTQTIVMPVIRGGLTRRVPGATIRMDQPAPTRQNVRPQDPDEVWDLVQQFESGVARALHEVRSEPTEEDATR